jgi:alkylated DNA repair protein alkB homolog 1
MYCRKGNRRKSCGSVEERVDLTEVVDLENGVYPESWGEVTQVCLDDVHHQMYMFARHPGLYILRGVMPDDLAYRLAEDCCTNTLLRPPATTNYNKSHGIQISGLWEAVHDDLNLSTTIDSSRNQDALPVSTWDANACGPAAKDLLQNLRWTSIGPVYDWTQRRYRIEDNHVPLPEYLYTFSTDIWSKVSDRVKGPAHPYTPNAALINYYREGDKLCGHKDDAEIDQTKPLVSISLGCPAIFLMGGQEKDIEPTPILLRHGDVVILSGDARQSYHGVPRIFPSVRKYPLEGAEKAWGPCPVDLPAEPTAIQNMLQTCRLNVSIRQV